MLILDFLITDKQNLRLDELSKLSKNIYVEKTIQFKKTKIGSFYLYFTYVGKYEEILNHKENTQFIVGNVLAFNNQSINIDTIQNDYVKFSKINKKDLDIVRNILGSSVTVSIKNEIISFRSDLISTIPTFFYVMSDGSHIFSSHINFINKIYSNLILDNVSSVEFLNFGKISFPFTIYKDVSQLSPASVSSYDSKNFLLKKNTYWRPHSNEHFKSLEQASNNINKIIHQHVKLCMQNIKKNALLMSGGEDSRLLACIMKKYGKFDGYIILEKHNREYDLALRSSQKIGFDLSLISMSDNFYFDILNQAINIAGNSNQYFHMFSLQKKLVDKLSDQNTVNVAHGYFSDVLLKGSRMHVSGLWRKFGILRKINSLKQTILNPKIFKIYKNKYFEKVKERRKLLKKNDYYKGLPADSEYFNFLPITNYKSCTVSTGQRRIFNLFEPFLSNEIVYLSCKVPENYKLNRRLFNSIYKKNCIKVKFLTHTDGRMPFFDYKANFFIRPLILFYRWLTRSNKKQGPWIDFKKFSQKKIINDYLFQQEHKNIKEISYSSSYKEFVEDKSFLNSKMTSLLQLIHILRDD